MMINEQDVDKFNENESLFIDYWSSRQKNLLNITKVNTKLRQVRNLPMYHNYYEVKLNTPF